MNYVPDRHISYRSWQYLFSTPLAEQKRSREVTKEQTANLYHRIFISAGFSASSVEKYHYHSDCRRHIRGNLILTTGILSVLQSRSHGVPVVVAIIRNKVLVNVYSVVKNQVKRLPLSWYGNNPFTCLNWEMVSGHPIFKKSWKFYLHKKAAYSG